MALTRPLHSAYLVSLQLDRWQYKPKGMFFCQQLWQSSRHRKNSENFSSLPFLTMQTCVQWNIRMLQPEADGQLFVAVKKPDNPVALCTIARDLEVNRNWHFYFFLTIQQGEPWSSESVFQRFYHQPLVMYPFAGQYCRQLLVRPHHCSCIWLITEMLLLTQLHKLFILGYKQHHWYVGLSLLKYKFQLAQITQWLHAIWNYMKMVKLSLSMVPPTL